MAIVLKCKKHPNYQGVKKKSGGNWCEICDWLWRVRNDPSWDPDISVVGDKPKKRKKHYHNHLGPQLG